MNTKDLLALSKKERADRTYQRIVYRKLVDLQTAIYQATKQDVPLGVLSELDTRHLIEELVELAGIEYRSLDEILAKLDAKEGDIDGEKESENVIEKALKTGKNEVNF